MRFQNVFHSPIDGTLETYSADFELIEQDRKAPRFSATVHTPVRKDSLSCAGPISRM